MYLKFKFNWMPVFFFLLAKSGSSDSTCCSWDSSTLLPAVVVPSFSFPQMGIWVISSVGLLWIVPHPCTWIFVNVCTQTPSVLSPAAATLSLPFRVRFLKKSLHCLATRMIFTWWHFPGRYSIHTENCINRAYRLINNHNVDARIAIT